MLEKKSSFDLSSNHFENSIWTKKKGIWWTSFFFQNDLLHFIKFKAVMDVGVLPLYITTLVENYWDVNSGKRLPNNTMMNWIL